LAQGAGEPTYVSRGEGFHNALSRLRMFERLGGRGEMRAPEALFS
jgi:hypothetical protein